MDYRENKDTMIAMDDAFEELDNTIHSIGGFIYDMLSAEKSGTLYRAPFIGQNREKLNPLFPEEWIDRLTDQTNYGKKLDFHPETDKISAPKGSQYA